MVRTWVAVVSGLVVHGACVVVASPSDSVPETNDVDCELSEWKPQTDCVATTLTQSFTRTITRPAHGRGRACGEMLETRACQPKPVHCEVSKWTRWSACAEDDYKTRTRTVTTSPLYGGRECPPTVDTVQCFANDCRMSAWSEWVCEPTDGLKTRTRHVTRAARGNGDPCPDELVESTACDPVNCVLGQEPWGPWSACDPETGTQTRTRPEAIPAKYGGVPCNPSDTTEHQLCAVDCVVVAAEDPRSGDFGACSRATAYMTKVLPIQHEPRNGGAVCPEETKRTVKKPCTLDAWLRTLTSERIATTEGHWLEYTAGELLGIQQHYWQYSVGKISASPIMVDAWNQLKLSNGDLCFGVLPRVLTLNVVCGESPTYYDFREPSICEYVATLRLPVAPACPSDCVRHVNATASATVQDCLV